MKASALALSVVLVGASSTAALAQDIAAPEVSSTAVLQAPPPAKPSGFLAKLFAPKAKKPGMRTNPTPGRHVETGPAVAAADPIVILPGAADAAAVSAPPPVAAPKPKLAAARAKPKPVAMIPVPRPRPELPVVLTSLPVAVVEAAPQETLASGIDPVVTGSVAPPAETTPAVTPHPPSAPTPAEAAPQADDTLEDVLPGDPTQYLGDGDLAPQPSAPASISGPARTVGSPYFAESAGPIEPAEQPFELLRALQLVQDKIAQGSTEALAAQRALRTDMEKKFAAAPASTWSDRRNAEAAVAYVLSGGSPTILRSLATLDPKPLIDLDLVTGVLAYSEGRENDAKRLLDKFDVMDVSPSMGAQLALAKSALAVRTDAKESMRLLSLARLLAPGTLVEEGALRRELFIADRLRDGAAVERLARQYLQRFRHSVYAGNFRTRFAAAISRMNFVRDRSGFTLIDDILQPVEPEAKGQLYLTIALAAVVKGNVEAGAFSSDRALTYAPSGSREEARAQLYRAASMVVDPKSFEVAAGAFATCRRALLGASDQALYDVVEVTISGVRSGTEASIKPTAVAQLAGSSLVEVTPMMTKARDILTATALVADPAP